MVIVGYETWPLLPQLQAVPKSRLSFRMCEFCQHLCCNCFTVHLIPLFSPVFFTFSQVLLLWALVDKFFFMLISVPNSVSQGTLHKILCHMSCQNNEIQMTPVQWDNFHPMLSAILSPLLLQSCQVLNQDLQSPLLSRSSTIQKEPKIVKYRVVRQSLNANFDFQILNSYNIMFRLWHLHCHIHPHLCVNNNVNQQKSHSVVSMQFTE